MKDFFGSMTGRVFLTLLLGVWISAALIQLAADYQRWRCWELDGYAGAIALSLIAVPVVVRTPAKMLRLVPATPMVGRSNWSR